MIYRNQILLIVFYWSFAIFCTPLKGITQTTGRVNLFKKQSLTELQQTDLSPKERNFQPVVGTPVNQNPILGNDPIEEQNRKMLAAHGMLPGTKQQQLTELRTELKQDEVKTQNDIYLAAQKPFLNNYNEFLKLDPDNFSITKAIFLTESAWYDNPPSFDEFNKAIQSRADLVKAILKREGLDDKNNIAINYAIQKLYKQENQFTDPKTKRVFTVPKLGYDFNDFMGEKNWANMFVTKLLITGKGQCHSLPLLYLAMAEKLRAKAYLSLSPQHSFIQFFDKNGYRYNFETTNGNLVTQTWMMQSTYINATALKNQTYLDTLSSRRLYAQILSDLLMNYTIKLGYDPTSTAMANKILSIDKNNVIALMSLANVYTFIARDKLKQAGNPPANQLSNYPEANEAYQNMQRSYELIEQTGFQDMPKEDYQRWLKTIDEEKKRQKNIEVQQQLKKEIERVKKLKFVIIDKTRN